MWGLGVVSTIFVCLMMMAGGVSFIFLLCALIYGARDSRMMAGVCYEMFKVILLIAVVMFGFFSIAQWVVPWILQSSGN